eukprot:14866833-Alexandrium_andersonii.AAC.1
MGPVRFPRVSESVAEWKGIAWARESKSAPNAGARHVAPASILPRPCRFQPAGVELLTCPA